MADTMDPKRPFDNLATIEHRSQALVTQLNDTTDKHPSVEQVRELALLVNDLSRHCQSIIRMVNGLGIV